jgi:2-phospho-L-lactate guanylyltransferase
MNHMETPCRPKSRAFFVRGTDPEVYMPVTALIPFKPGNPKTRLSCVLDADERITFARLMLADVVRAVRGAGCEPRIISTEEYSCSIAVVDVIPGGLNETLNDLLEVMDGEVLIIMSDLPLSNPEALVRLITTEHDMAIVPGRGGGTNVIYLSRGSDFRVSYYGSSFLKHLRIAEERNLSCEIIDSYRLSTDIDEKEDLPELLIHGQGKSREYLESLGFSISIEKGRVGVTRPEKT